MKFSSKVNIFVKSGFGGQGIIAWRRESRVRFGGPAGGNGGNGGSVYVKADKNLNSLYHLHYKKHFFANDGENGRNKSQNGKNAEDIYVFVPCGTNVYDNKTGNKIGELLFADDEILICKGGRGGRGNLFFKNSSNPAPFMYELGDPAEEKEIILDLECIADVGFLGLPNAGKSTLLSSISNAKPKIADFPFTTIIPILGSVVFNNKKAIFADIPGLIKGASSGMGLGFEFLKHLNRCDILVHVIDCSEKNWFEEIKSIENEINQYSKTLFSKTRILAFNKIDKLSPSELISIEEKIKNLEYKNYSFISAKKKINIEKFLNNVFPFISEKSKIKNISEPEYLEFSDSYDKVLDFYIYKKDDFWFVEHEQLKYWVHKIPTTTDDNLNRLITKINNLGVNKQLKKMKAKNGDKVVIYDFQYEFSQ